MPALSPTMTKGNVGVWKKKEGDAVKAGEVLCEIETDKANMSLEATEDGVVAKILVPSGSQDVPLGRTLAIIVEDKSSVSQFANFKGDDSAAKAEATPAKAPAAPAPAAAAAPKQAAPKSSKQCMFITIARTFYLLPRPSPYASRHASLVAYHDSGQRRCMEEEGGR